MTQPALTWVTAVTMSAPLARRPTPPSVVGAGEERSAGMASALRQRPTPPAPQTAHHHCFVVTASVTPRRAAMSVQATAVPVPRRAEMASATQPRMQRAAPQTASVIRGNSRPVMVDAARSRPGSAMGSATPSSTARNTTSTGVTANQPPSVAMASVSQAKPSAAPRTARVAAAQEGIARKTARVSPRSAHSTPTAAIAGTPTVINAPRLAQG